MLLGFDGFTTLLTTIQLIAEVFVMGTILFALALFFREKISSTKLMQGGYSLSIVFWMYGVFFTLLLAGALGFYIYEKTDMYGLEGKAIVDSPLDAMSLLSAISLAVVVLIIHFYMAAISIWKSADNYTGFFLLRWWARQLSAVMLLCVVMLAIFRPFAIIMGGALYWVADRFIRRHKK